MIPPALYPLFAQQWASKPDDKKFWLVCAGFHPVGIQGVTVGYEICWRAANDLAQMGFATAPKLAGQVEMVHREVHESFNELVARANRIVIDEANAVIGNMPRKMVA